MGFFQFEMIITVLVSSFWFIWIPMLWVYDHYNYFKSYSAENDFRRQNLTSTDVRFWRLKSVPALWELNPGASLSILLCYSISYESLKWLTLLFMMFLTYDPHLIIKALKYFYIKYFYIKIFLYKP